MEKIKTITQRLSPGHCLILLFHGVVEKHISPIRNYTRKHIEVEFFHNLLQELKKQGQALSMDDCVRIKNSGENYPDNSFVVTFDDGFENNYSVAAPVLDKLKVPATFYVSTDFIQNNSMSWIDRIEFMLETQKPASVRLPWEGGLRTLSNPNFILECLIEIRRKVKGDPSVSAEELIQNLANQWEISAPLNETGRLDRKMSWEQVKALAAHPLFTVGGHSHHHLNLAFLNTEEMQSEINTSLMLLDSHLLTRTTHYCYPEGLENCYNQEIIDHLKSKNILASPTAIDGINSRDTDLFHLKRVMVVD